MSEIANHVRTERGEAEPEGPRPLTREEDASEPYPVEALGTLRQAVEAIVQFSRAPPALCAHAVLAAASLVTQAHADIVLPSGQIKPLSLFLLTIAASGERKRAVERLAMEAIDGCQHDLGAIDAGSDSIPSLAPMLVSRQSTFKDLRAFATGSQPVMGLFPAGSGFPDGVVKSAPTLASLWDGDPTTVEIANQHTVMAGRRLSMHVKVNPDVATRLFNHDGLINQGILSRLLAVAPPGTGGTRKFEDPPASAAQDLTRYREQMARLLAFPPKPRHIGLSVDAKKVWINLHDDIEADLGEYGCWSPIADFASKAAEHAIRLAAVQTLWGDPDAVEISAASMANASTLIQFYLQENRRLRAVATTHRTLSLAQRVLDWLLHKWDEPAIYAAVIYNTGPVRAVRDRKTALKLIAVLVEHGWLHPVKERICITGKIRKEAWLIHGKTRR